MPAKKKRKVARKRNVIRLAVVDDHQLFRAGIKSLLKEYSDLRVVIEASNGKDLLRQMKNIPVDLVLLDIEMPEMDGMQTTTELRNRYPGVNVLILTMHQEQELIFDLINRGAHGFLPKHKSMEVLVDAIYIITDRGRYYSEEVMTAMNNGKRGKIKNIIHPPELSAREAVVTKMLCLGRTIDEIADELNVSPRTVEVHRTTVYGKTKVKNRAELVLYAIKTGMISTTQVEDNSNQ